MKRVTLRDVALKANVSHQTVSNVLNGLPSVGSDIRARVLEAAEALDYYPNQAAKALREERVTTLCSVFLRGELGDVQDPYLNMIQSVLIRQAHALGFSMTSTFLELDKPETFEKVRQEFRQRKFAGIILAAEHLNDEQLDKIHNWNLPTVLFNQFGYPRFPSVTADFAGAMEQIVAHHASRQRKRLALILPINQTMVLPTARLRYQGFMQACQAHSVSGFVQDGDWTFQSGYDAFKALWSAANRPDAILAANDRMGAGALRAAYELGISVPSQIAISGFDDFEFSAYTVPSMTTVQVPFVAMICEALQLLLEVLQGNDSGEVREFPTELVIRESS